MSSDHGRDYRLPPVPVAQEERWRAEWENAEREQRELILGRATLPAPQVVVDFDSLPPSRVVQVISGELGKSLWCFPVGSELHQRMGSRTAKYQPRRYAYARVDFARYEGTVAGPVRHWRRPGAPPVAPYAPNFGSWYHCVQQRRVYRHTQAEF